MTCADFCSDELLRHVSKKLSFNQPSLFGAVILNAKAETEKVRGGSVQRST